MAFSQGQLYFAIGFFILFAIGMVYAYRSDLKRMSSGKKDARNVLIFIVIVMGSFFAIIKYIGS
jgi:hypothetical protein